MPDMLRVAAVCTLASLLLSVFARTQEPPTELTEKRLTSSNNEIRWYAADEKSTNVSDKILDHVDRASPIATLPPWIMPQGEFYFLRGFAPVPGPVAVDPFNLGVVINPLVCRDSEDCAVSSLAFRFGWWATVLNGNPVKVGEYQVVGPSPFWDADGLLTDGYRTLDFFATGLDNESTQTNLLFFQDSLRANVGFQRFPHRLEHDPLTNFKSANGFEKQDLNVGEDYAIRVEEFRGEIAENLTENVRVRVQAWGMRKFGERQANAMTHCFQSQGISGRNCHILSQRQQIDWLTVQVTPRVEGRFGPVTVEYSRPMRQFSQDDQFVTRLYNGFPPIINGVYPYAIVPDNTTQIDQLRLGIDLAERTKFYGYGYGGQTQNHFRDVRRDFTGYDFRLTDSTVSGVSLTAYTSAYHQNGTRPSTFLPDETQFLTPQETQEAIPDPVEYHRTTAGLRGRWRPPLLRPVFHRLAFTGGYEYDFLDRDYAIYRQSDGAFEFAQGDTATHTLYVGTQKTWLSTLDSYSRYKVLFVKNPLNGFSSGSGVVNSALPEQRHIVEVGGGWYPLGNFGVSVHQEFDLGWNFADSSPIPENVVDFGEDSYATTATVWYAPTSKLSLTAGVSFMSNWIDQNITLGDDYIAPGSPAGDLLPPETRRWNYGGTANLASVKANYRLTENVWLHGGLEYTRGNNQFNSSGFADLWPDLPAYSDVVVVTYRTSAGLDWKVREATSVYFRYVYFNYDDKTMAFNSGELHLFLAGLAMTF